MPGAEKAIFVLKRRTNKVARTTPTMRMGVQQPSPRKDPEQEADRAKDEEASGGAPTKYRGRRRDDRPHLPDIARTLYQAWLFRGMPMWAKLQGR